MALGTARATRFRLLTYNIQVGIRTRSRAEQVAQLWRHVLPTRSSHQHLLPLVQVVRGYDLVAVQEADMGSLRTRSLNLLRFLAQRAGYPLWHAQPTRRLRPIAHHALGVMSQVQINALSAHALPGRISGRKALICDCGSVPNSLLVVLTHLSLGATDRARQLHRLAELTAAGRHIILMGDLNCESRELQAHPWLRQRGFVAPVERLPSYPSWDPYRQIDHILVSDPLRIEQARVLPFCWSDHLPISLDVILPPGLEVRYLNQHAPRAAL